MLRLTGRLGALDGCRDDSAYRPATHVVHSPSASAGGGGGGAGVSRCRGLGEGSEGGGEGEGVQEAPLGGWGSPGRVIWGGGGGAHTGTYKRWSITGSPYLPLPSL